MKVRRLPFILAAFLLLALIGCSRQAPPASSEKPAGQAVAPPPTGQPGQQPGAPESQAPAAAAGAQAAGEAAGPAAGEAQPAQGGPSAAPGSGPTYNTAVPPPAGGGTAAKPYAGGAAAAAPSAPAAPAPPPPPRTFTLAQDRALEVKLVTEVSTKTAKAGDTFRAYLTSPIADGDWTIAQQGAEVTGVVQSSDPGGRVKGRASITVALQTLQLADGSTVQLRTSSYSTEAKSGAKKDAAKIGIGTAAGAGIGAIVGGGKGAAIGAAVGGGGAAGATLATHGSPAVIAPGAVVMFRLRAPITVTKK